jgi:hypothetical protein
VLGGSNIQRKYRHRIPELHRASIDTRIQWLWNQRFGTVQMVFKESPDVLDVTAATLILQALIGHDLDSIIQMFQRLEGGAIADDKIADDTLVV